MEISQKVCMYVTGLQQEMNTVGFYFNFFFNR